ncbi:MAG: hypothetical protein LBL69_06810, partial [Zoogloeaceae bacterium]|nr:hypothetical protein [Zoogloeaceae bacterium]
MVDIMLRKHSYARVLWVGLSLFCASAASWAADYTLDFGAPNCGLTGLAANTCSAAGSACTCTKAVTFGANSTLTAPDGATLIFKDAFTTGTNTVLGKEGQALDLQIQGSKTLTVSDGAQVHANLASSGTSIISVGNNVLIDGDINSDSDNYIWLKGTHITVNGGIRSTTHKTTYGGYLYLRNNAGVGCCAAVAGTLDGGSPRYIMIKKDVTVWGYVSTYS